MKIALVVPGGVDRSGTHRVIPCLLWLLERLAAHHDVHVFALFQEARACRYDLLGGAVHAAGRTAPRVASVGAILREHRRGPFDVLHAFWVPPGVVAGAAGALLGVPVLLHLAGGELVAMPAIGYGGLRTVAGRLQARFALQRARVVTASTDAMLDRIATHDVVAQKLVLGVDLAHWPPRAPRPRSPDRPLRLLHVATLNRVKDQETLLRAVADLQETCTPFRLDVVGEDTLDGAVHRLATSLGLDRVVTFHGFLPQERVFQLMSQADLHVMSSRFEAAEMVTLEAAAVGVPSVGTDVGRIGEWAPDAAVAARPGDAVGLAAAIRRLAADDEARLGIAYRAHQLALACDADATAAQVETLYRAVARPAAAAV